MHGFPLHDIPSIPLNSESRTLATRFRPSRRTPMQSVRTQPQALSVHRAARGAVGLVLCLGSAKYCEASAYAKDPVVAAPNPARNEALTSVAEGGTAASNEESRAVVLRVSSTLGEGDDVVQEEVLRVVQNVFSSHGYSVDESAALMVHIIVGRPNKGRPGYHLTLGYSTAKDEPPKVAKTYFCPKCSASDMLTRCGGLAETFIADLDNANSTSATVDVANDGRREEEQAPAAPTRKAASAPRIDPHGPRLMAAGIMLTVIGGTTVLAGGTGSIVADRSGFNVPPAAWAAVGAGAVVTATGVALLVVGRKRMSKSKNHARLGAWPMRRGVVFSVARRF